MSVRITPFDYAVANTTTTSDAGANDFCAPTTPAVDDDSFSQLVEACSELREFYELERCLGRASWLSEIIEDFEALIARLEPSQLSI